MSNKIKSLFKLKNLFLKIDFRECSFFIESKKKLLCSVVLPYKVLLKGGVLENSFKIAAYSPKKRLENRLRKRLKKKLGFFFYFLDKSLISKKQVTVRSIFLIGTGFKVFKSRQLKNRYLVFKIGLSHLVKIFIPAGIHFKVVKLNAIEFHSLDKELLGSFLNFVASIRFPDSYKGRGLLISNQPKVKFKVGKVKS